MNDDADQRSAMSDDTAQRELAAFQAALLTLLATDLPPDEMRRRLASDPAFGPYQNYVAEFEPRMIEVAAELVKKWGQR